VTAEAESCARKLLEAVRGLRDAGVPPCDIAKALAGNLIAYCDRTGLDVHEVVGQVFESTRMLFASLKSVERSGSN
jgi:hypothetical protein